MIAVLLLALFSSGAIAVNGGGLIIDHDGGADDAMAIFMAVLYEKYFNGPPVLALTTNHGNVDEDQSFINSQRILDIAGRRNIPIYRGTNSSIILDVASDHFFGVDGLGDNEHKEFEAIPAQPQHAVEALIEFTKSYPEEIEILTLGSLTNIALAIRLDPGFISRLGHLYVAAGHVYSESYPEPEYNALQDAEAYHIVAANANPDKVTILPFSQLKTVSISKDWRRNVLGAIPTEIMKEQNSFERKSLQSKSSSWTLLDPAAMGVVLNSSLINDIKYSDNSIILCGEQRGINTNNFTTKENANVRVYNGMDDQSYQDMLISIFSAELK